MEPDMVQRKVKSNLNKMTPEKFEKISNQILEIAAQSKNETDGRTLRQVIQLTFEKATDEAHWASMYARFCRVMLDSMHPDVKDDSVKDKNGSIVTGGNLFRKYLLTRCQEEFERGWKSKLPPKPEGETEETVMMSDDYYVAAAAKRRGLGLVQFIGELYKLGMLTEGIMHRCVKKLVDYDGTPDEAEIESLTKLLRTIGTNLDSTDRGEIVMNAYFERIQAMIQTPDLPSRLRFMLMVCDRTLPPSFFFFIIPQLVLCSEHGARNDLLTSVIRAGYSGPTQKGLGDERGEQGTSDDSRDPRAGKLPSITFGFATDIESNAHSVPRSL